MRVFINKNKLIINISSNFIAIFINIIISILMTPFLIHKLGIQLFGIVSLVNTFPSYIQLGSNGLYNSATKYMSISLEKKNHVLANVYFNTTFKLMIYWVLILLPLTLIISIITPNLFNVPASSENQSRILVFFVLASTFFNILLSPIRSVFEIHQEHLIKNTITIISKIIAMLILVALFQFFTPSIVFVGIYQLVLTSVTFILFTLFYKKFQNVFKLNLNIFQKSVVGELKSLAFWNTIDDFAVLFFLMASQGLINKLLGPLEGGFFAPVILIISLLIFASNAISNVMMPIVYRGLAINKSRKEMEDKLFFISKLLLFILGGGIIFFTFFSELVITMWLGENFIKIIPVVQIFINTYLFGSIIYLPYYHYFRGQDKMKIPAIVNFVAGILNLISIVILIELGFGLMAVAYSFLGTFGLKGIVFYITYLSKVGYYNFRHYLVKNLIILVCYFLNYLVLYCLVSIGFGFYLSFLIFFVFYITIVWNVGLKNNERTFILNTIMKIK